MRFCDIFGIERISRSTHFNHQKRYLHATIHTMWKQEQGELVEQLKQDNMPLVLAGDGRSDSPGHSAKFGGYNVMECRLKRILDIQVVQVSNLNVFNIIM